MPDIPAGGPPPVPIEFGSLEWEEVERDGPRSAARAQAQSARKTIEVGAAKLDWKRCRAEGPGQDSTTRPSQQEPAEGTTRRVLFVSMKEAGGGRPARSHPPPSASAALLVPATM